MALAAVPSGLLVAVTAHISTDVAASPFLWVIPLALYLATFVIAFQTRPLLPHRWMSAIQPSAIILLVVWYAIDPMEEIFSAIAVNMIAFFVLALVCHGELARRRPPARYLTGFYLWLSAGGVIGGVFAGMVAMHLFTWVAEYPLLILAAALCRPGVRLPRGAGDFAFIALAVAAVAAMAAVAHGWRYEFLARPFDLVAAAVLLVAFLVQRHVVRFTAAIATVFAFAYFFGKDSGDRDFVRSFFGVHKVSESDGGRFRILMHGVIEHGAQRIRDDQGRPLTGRPKPLTYYYDGSPMEQGIASVRERRGGPIRIGVVGLGTGSLACQTRPGDSITFYEIDPAVAAIARDPRRFTYMSECAPNAPVVIGDARLTLGDAADGAYDVLLIDAFSSDAIPTHLLTREAMALYIRKVAPDGVVLMHVTNQHMILAPVVAGVAAANGLLARTNEGEEDPDEAEHLFVSTVVAVVRQGEHFGKLAQSDEWTVELPNEADSVWTDDYSNVIGAMIRNLRK